jgi:hypothetical protein
LFVGSFSYRSVVATIIIVSFSLFIWFSRSISRAEFSLSRLDVGSSASMTFGVLANDLMVATRCLSPPLRVSGSLCAQRGVPNRPAHAYS